MKFAQSIASTFFYQAIDHKGVCSRRVYWYSFAVACLSWVVVAILLYLPSFIVLFSEDIQALEYLESLNTVTMILGLSSLAYVSVCMIFAMTRRLRDAGFWPWLSVVYVALLFIPIAREIAFVLLVIFCSFPTKRKQAIVQV